MLEHYSHIRLEAKRKALESLDNVTFLAQIQHRAFPEGEPSKSQTPESLPVDLVGTGRFELPTPRTPSECSTRLSHVPTGRSRSTAADGLLGSSLVYTAARLR